MPRSLKPFAIVVALLLSWAVVNAVVQHSLGKWLPTGAEPGIAERALMDSHLWVLRWLPILMAPAFLAPIGATAYWLLAASRHWPQVAGEDAISNLKIWLKVLAAVLVGGIVLLIGVKWSSGRTTDIGLAMLAAFGWSYAAAMYNALSAQKMLHESGISRWSGKAVAWAALAIVNCAFVHPFGVGIPIWVARAARHRSAG